MTGHEPDRIAELQRLRDAWPAKVKGTAADPFPHLSGWCGNAFPLDHPNHRRCRGTAESPVRGYLACICPCHTAGVIACGDATDADMAAVRGFAAALRNGTVDEYAAAVVDTQGRVNAMLQNADVATVSYGYRSATADGAAATVTVTGERWVWEADAAADVMLTEDGGCPICSEDWPAHMFLDDGRVACP